MFEATDISARPLDTDTIIRLADEGLPVCAMARSTKIPSQLIREVIKEAVEAGVLVEPPPEDWPPGSNRASRPGRLPELLENNERLFVACARYFGTTRQQSIVLGMLLKRSEVTKEQLHQTIEFYRSEAIEQTDIKLVDVLICILRRKLKSFNLEIKTMWGIGYLMEPPDRIKAIQALQDFVKKNHEALEALAA